MTNHCDLEKEWLIQDRYHDRYYLLAYLGKVYRIYLNSPFPRDALLKLVSNFSITPVPPALQNLHLLHRRVSAHRHEDERSGLEGRRSSVAQLLFPWLFETGIARASFLRSQTLAALGEASLLQRHDRLPPNGRPVLKLGFYWLLACTGVRGSLVEERQGRTT